MTVSVMLLMDQTILGRIQHIKGTIIFPLIFHGGIKTSMEYRYILRVTTFLYLRLELVLLRHLDPRARRGEVTECGQALQVRCGRRLGQDRRPAAGELAHETWCGGRRYRDHDERRAIGLQLVEGGVDRHAPIGEGEIGLECFKFVMTHPKLKHLPKYLETPVGLDGWKKEIALLKKYAQ